MVEAAGQSESLKRVIDAVLTEEGIEHRFVHHAAITSVQEALEKGVPAQLGIPLDNTIKNLLLRNSKHELFLLVVPGMKRVNLHALAQALGVSHLSMARLDEARGLFGAHKGSVSLFDVLKEPVMVAGAEESGVESSGSGTDSVDAVVAVAGVTVTLIVDESITNIAGFIAFPAGSDTESVLVPASAITTIVEALTARTRHSAEFVALAD